MQNFFDAYGVYKTIYCWTFLQCLIIDFPLSQVSIFQKKKFVVKILDSLENILSLDFEIILRSNSTTAQVPSFVLYKHFFTINLMMACL